MKLIQVSETLVVNPAHVAFAEWQGEELHLHLSIADSPTGHAVIRLVDQPAKRMWANLETQCSGYRDEK